MILRPVEPGDPASEKFLPAWEAVEHTQKRSCARFWMITQPSHAVLAAGLAANLNAAQFPVPDEPLLQAIALHDAGWGVPDAQAIVKSRSIHPQAPQSFVAMAVPQFLEAWEKSIETAESVSPAGGYIVSRHFWRLAEHRSTLEESKPDRQKLDSFLKNEERRQKKLAARQSRSSQQLEQFTDVLQFCDLLSLYICSGSSLCVVFPEHFGVQLRITPGGGAYRLDPPLIKSGTMFAVAALRYPATKAESSREIPIKIA